MHSSNPTLSDKAFQTSSSLSSSSAMTQSGTFNKLAILLLLCVATASYTFINPNPALMMLGVFGGLILALVSVFKKNWTPVTAPLYALLEGLALGGISFTYASQYPGIVQNAIMLTFAVMAIMFCVYRYEIIKVTDKLKTMIFVGTAAVGVVYLISFIMSFFGKSIPMIHSNGPIGIGFSLVVVGIASFSLLLDFDFIQNTSRSGRYPKYMEWYGAFGLMVTLIWLYIEILRLLSKLNSRR